MHEPGLYIEALNSMTEGLKNKLKDRYAESMQRPSMFSPEIAGDIEAVESNQEVQPPKPSKYEMVNRLFEEPPFEAGVPREEFPEMTPEEMQLAEAIQ